MIIKKLNDFVFIHFGKYFFIALHGWQWDLSIVIPSYKNWSRLDIYTPLVDLEVCGWLFWGKKPGR